MTRVLLACLAVLLVAAPASASESSMLAADASARTLHLVPLPDLPDRRMPAANMDEAAMKTARGLNPFLKVAPLAIGIPLGVAGISILASVPIALSANDPFAAASMYNGGVGIMGGAFAAVLTFNILARTLRFFLDAGDWQKDIAFLAAGSGLAISGYALASIAGRFALIGTWPDGAIAAGLVGGATLWGVGLALLMIDTLRTTWKDNDPVITLRAGDQGMQFAGIWAAPVDHGPGEVAAAAGVVLRW
ncbi:MAG: hypothetical protein KDA24_07710 [Deltaproteobacteria bacterium]|nr:hypothetical protein [Deltaproteobacteria bacterium]